MTFGVDQVVQPCHEHSDVAIPVKDLLDADGGLDIYPDIAGKGYFDIDYRKGELVLKSKGFVGLIPISDRIAIRVEPRVPIANLMYMIWRAGGEMVSLKSFLRTYQDVPGTVDDPERLYVDAFASASDGVRRAGLLKQYLHRESERETRGRLLLGRTVSRFRSHGVRHRHVFDVADHTVSNVANRTLKATAERLLRRVVADRTTFDDDSATALRAMLTVFEPVVVGGLSTQEIARETPAIVRGLPNSHRSCEPALWLAYLIATNSGVVMESVGRAKFESVIIDVAKVFERYVRKLCEERAGTHFGGCRVVDGNVKPVSLFVSGGKSETHPDVYFKRGGTFVAVADAKYKPNVATADRYEMLAFCEAMQVDRAAFIVPRRPGQPDTTVHGRTPGGRTLHVVGIDLDARDQEAEEARFVTCLASTLGF